MEQRIIRNVKAERERHLKYYVGRYKPEELGAMALMRRQIFCFYRNAGCGKILQLLRYYRGDSIAVYGDNIHRKEMVQALGSCGIDAGEDWEWVKAGLYKNERTGRCYFC